MKRVILSLIAVCSTLISFSQDVIVTVDEQQIQAKILEISNTEIKYLDYNNQDGPIYVLTNVVKKCCRTYYYNYHNHYNYYVRYFTKSHPFWE